MVRDSQGAYIGAVQAVGSKVTNPLESQLQAILMATLLELKASYTDNGKDCKRAMYILNQRSLTFPAYNWIREIRQWVRKFQKVPFQ